MTACFTGPRPKDLFGYGARHHYASIVDVVQEVCEGLYSHGVTDFISGGAQGFDQLAFWAVNRLGSKVNNIVYVPFEAQPSRWQAEGLFSQSDYNLMLKHADKVVTLFPDPSCPAEAAAKLFGRNHAMVDASDIVVALLAGRSLDWRKSAGGTAECMRYAASKHKPILVIRTDGMRSWLNGRDPFK